MASHSPFGGSSYGSTPAIPASSAPNSSLTSDETSIIQSIRNQKITTLAFGLAVLLSILISFILGIVVTVQKPESAGQLFCLSLGLLLMGIGELFLMRFSMKDQLSSTTTWSLYAIGLCLFIESILNDVFMYM